MQAPNNCLEEREEDWKEPTQGPHGEKAHILHKQRSPEYRFYPSPWREIPGMMETERPKAFSAA